MGAKLKQQWSEEETVSLLVCLDVTVGTQTQEQNFN